MVSVLLSLGSLVLLGSFLVTVGSASQFCILKEQDCSANKARMIKTYRMEIFKIISPRII